MRFLASGGYYMTRRTNQFQGNNQIIQPDNIGFFRQVLPLLVEEVALEMNQPHQFIGY